MSDDIVGMKGRNSKKHGHTWVSYGCLTLQVKTYVCTYFENFLRTLRNLYQPDTNFNCMRADVYVYVNV